MGQELSGLVVLCIENDREEKAKLGQRRTLQHTGQHVFQVRKVFLKNYQWEFSVANNLHNFLLI